MVNAAIGGGPMVVTPCSVLVVEDNRDGRESLRMLLQLLGHQVEVAADGVEGVEKGLRSRPQVAVVDIGLPGLDGFEVARRLRAALGPDILLLAHSAYTNPQERDWALAAGFNGFLPKPMDVDELESWLAVAAASRPFEIVPGYEADDHRRRA